MKAMERGWLLLGVAVLVVAGCGDDGDKAGDGGAGEGGAGASGAGAGGGGGAGAGGTGGAGGAGAGGAGAGAGGAGTGGAGGAMADGGMPPAMDGGSEPEPEPLKTDGTLLALCEDGTECGFELDCYGSASGGGFCTSLCTEDTDCEAVGEAFTCSSGGLCRQSCDGTDDDVCPERMSCVMTGGFGGPGGGGNATFACAYGPNAGEPQPDAFGECAGDQACGMGRMCAGDAMGNTGYCTESCNDDTDCDGIEVASGNLEPTCEFSAAGGAPSAVCALNCDGADAECPDGMACVESMGPLPSLCGYE